MVKQAMRIAETVYRETANTTASSWAGLLALTIEELVSSGCSCGGPWRKVRATDKATGKTGLGVRCDACDIFIPVIW